MTFVRNWLIILSLSLYSSWGCAATILVMGDSISAGYGLQPGEGWVALLQTRLAKQKHIDLVNASVSGETTSGGLTRLPKLLNEYKPAIVILELGGNDGLRGQPLSLMRKNLQDMVDACKQSGAQILLVGMQIPTNYGNRYTQDFKKIYAELANKNQVPLVPFLLEGVATHAELMQNDGIHPNAGAQAQLLNNLYPFLEPLLKPLHH